MSIFDVLNAQLDRAAEKISGWIIDRRRTNEDYITVLTFSLCMKLMKEECTQHPEIKFFTLSAESNNIPKNKYDNVIVTLSLLDAECNVLRFTCRHALPKSRLCSAARNP